MTCACKCPIPVCTCIDHIHTDLCTQIAYLFPYVMCHANATMFWTMNLFLGILTAGFIYEW